MTKTTPNLTDMTEFDLVMMLNEVKRSDDQSDKDFAKAIVDEIKRRKPS